MFGYIRIRKDDLKFRDFRTYKQKYCTLCHFLGKNYGLIYSTITSYDIVFLILSLENFEEAIYSIKFRCPINPVKKMNANISEQVMEYSAFINYYLAVLKLEDDVVDDKSFLKKIMVKLFMYNSKYNTMKNVFGDRWAVMSNLIDHVNSLEISNANFDVLTNSFGEFFAEIFTLFVDYYQINSAESYDSFYSLYFNMGKWIYIMDAYDDYNEDIEAGKFNLLKNIMQEDYSINKIKAHKKIYTINEMLIYKMREAYCQIKWNKYGELIYNIITLGCKDVYSTIMHRRYPQIESIIVCEENS